MIEIYKTAQLDLETLDKPEKGCWVKVTTPLTSELEELSSKLQIPRSFLADPLDVDERARIEKEDKNILIVIRVPYFDELSNDIPFTTLPLGIIFTEDMIISVCNKEVQIFEDFINKRVKAFSTDDNTRFLCQILLRTSLLYLKGLKQINTLTSRIEMELRHSLRNEELIKLLNCEKSLVFFTTSLKSNEIMIERLIRTQPFTDDDTKDRLDDIMVENRQAIEMANIYSNILSGMMDAFASVISNNLTVVMKVLTSITIILMLPTLVASVYGMNVKLPFQDSPHAFLITMIISVMLSVIGVFIFMKRRWF